MARTRVTTHRIAAGELPPPEEKRAGKSAEFAFGYVKSLLLNNILVAGENFSAEEVANRLNLSRHPVMEALKRLETEGFIRILPQVGCVVVDVEPEEIADFYLIMSKVEGELAARAASNRTEQEIGELDIISERVKRYLRERHTPEEKLKIYRRLNRSFHGQIHRMARSEIIGKMAIGFWDRSDFYISSVPITPVFVKRMGTVQSEHDEVRRAIERRDADAAREAMERHLLETGRSVCARRAALR